MCDLAHHAPPNKLVALDRCAGVGVKGPDACASGGAAKEVEAPKDGSATPMSLSNCSRESFVEDGANKVGWRTGTFWSRAGWPGFGTRVVACRNDRAGNRNQADGGRPKNL